MTQHPTDKNEQTGALRFDKPMESDAGGPRRAATVFTCALHRVRRGRRSAFSATPPPPTPEPGKRPSRIAITLALGHKIEQAILEGKLKVADAARRFGLGRARVSQLCDLTLLPVMQQERILFTEADERSWRRLSGSGESALKGSSAAL
ncbi:MAG: hypothetical protein FJ109_03180 [Deltaproteobacteria bacterium]|nr:hypothetical protein [Deltaproteobacteria bacterium]